MFKLFYASTSPYVRKVVVSAILLGLRDKITYLPSAAHPVHRDLSIAEHNPLAKVPTLINEHGQSFFDSRVICEYLDALAGGGLIFPKVGAARWDALIHQSLGDGLLDAALLARYERSARPVQFQWDIWREAQLTKIEASLVQIESLASSLRIDRPTIGEISLGCALGYLDFRFADHPWRERYCATAKWFDAFNATTAMVATIPSESI